jgi:hypothetical protein
MKSKHKIKTLFRQQPQNHWSRIRPHFKARQTSGLASVEVPDVDNEGNPTDDPEKAVAWKRITKSSEVETTLLNRNRIHFGQAQTRRKPRKSSCTKAPIRE